MGRARTLFGISIFWLALSMLSDGITTLVLPYHLATFVGSERQATILGLIAFAGLVAGMLVQPLAGVWSDRVRARWGRRGPLAFGAVLTLAALAMFAATRSLAAVVAAYLGVQIAAAVAQAAQQGFIPDLVPPRLRGTASGLKGFMDVGGALLAFAILGSLLAGGLIGPALLAIGLVVAGLLALTLLIVREPTVPTASTPRVTVRQIFGLDLRQHPGFARVVIARFLFLLGTYAVGRFFLYFVTVRLGLAPEQAPEQAGGLLAALTLMTVAGAPPAGWAADRFGRRPLMVAGAVLNAAGILLLIGAYDATAILACGALMALGSAAFAGANWAMTADLAPPGEAARFFALANFGTAGAAAAASLFGLLVDAGNQASPGLGYVALLAAGSLASLASILPLRSAALTSLPDRHTLTGSSVSIGELK